MVRTGLKISSIILLSVLLSACGTRYQTAKSLDQSLPLSANQIKATLIEAAEDNKWTVCESGPNALRFELPYKNWTVYADAEYANNTYSLKPNTALTTLRDDNDHIHRNVNRLVNRLNQRVLYLSRTVGSDQHPHNKTLEPCAPYEEVDILKGGLPLSRYQVNTKFGWVNPKLAPTIHSKFTVSVERENRYVDQKIVKSMRQRMTQFLKERDLFADQLSESYKIKITIKEYEPALAEISGQRLKADILIESPKGSKVCIMNSSTDIRSYESITTLVYQESNRITAALSEAILKSLEKRLAGREPEGH